MLQIKPEYIDIHAHINFPDYKDDRGEVINRAIRENVWFMNVGTDIHTSKEVLEIANKYENLYACIGIHPTHTNNIKGGDIDELEKLIVDKKVKAIGECGLDYFRMEDDTKNLQVELFEKQIYLAKKYNKPLMLHIRNAYEDAIEIIKNHEGIRGNVHFFAGDYEIAKKFLKLDFTLSFTGVITFADSYNEVIKNIPIESIISETDCPYVSPIPNRGKRNEPAYVKEIVKKISEIKNLDLDFTKKTIVNNAFRVFDF